MAIPTFWIYINFFVKSFTEVSYFLTFQIPLIQNGGESDFDFIQRIVDRANASFQQKDYSTLKKFLDGLKQSNSELNLQIPKYNREDSVETDLLNLWVNEAIDPYSTLNIGHD